MDAHEEPTDHTSAPAPGPGTTIGGEDLDWALARLEQLVRIESPSSDRAASLAITDALTEGFEACGGLVTPIDYEGGRHLLVEVEGRGDPLLLVGHSDTVWSRGSLDSVVPWGRDEEAVYGPGCYDMKGGLVVMEAALRLVPPDRRRRVRILVTADEEIGSGDGQRLFPEATAGVVGALGFESPHPDGALKVGRRGSTRVRVTVTGVEAHAALDLVHGASAIDELISQIDVTRRVVEAASSHGPEVLLNIGTISGGTRANVTAGHAEAELGLRFQDGATEAEVLTAVEALSPVDPRTAVTTTVLSHRPAWAPSSRDRDLLAWVEGIGRTLGIPCQGRPAAGAGDLNQIGSMGVASIDGFGPSGGGAHAIGEHVDIRGLGQRIALVAAILRAPGTATA